MTWPTSGGGGGGAPSGPAGGVLAGTYPNPTLAATAAGTTAALGNSSTLLATTAFIARAIAQGIPVFNVKGAPYNAAGDGITDDSTAIQAAINDASAAGGGIVWLPLAIYQLIAAGLTVPAGVTLAGVPGYVRETQTQTGTLLRVAHNASISPVTVSSGTGATIRDLSIAMALSAGAGASNSTAGLTISGSVFTNVVNVTIVDFGVGVNVIGNTIQCFFDRVFVLTQGVTTTTAYGYKMGTTGGQNASIYFRHCSVAFGSFGGTTSYGFYAAGSNISDLFITNCEADSMTYGFYLDGSGAGANGAIDIHLISCVADACQNGAYITGVGVGGASTGALDLDSFFCSLSGSGTGITITTNSTGIRVRGAQISGVAGTSVGISISGSVLDCAVSDCIITKLITTGIIVDGSATVTLHGNNIVPTSAASTGIQLTNSATVCTVVANAIRGLGITMTNGIKVDAGCSQIAVTDNAIDGGTITNPIVIATGLTGIIAHGNVGGAASIVTTPSVSSGSAFTPSTVADTMVYIQTSSVAAGTITVTMGPSTGTENTIVNAQATLANATDFTTLRVPVAWKVVATLTGAGAAFTRTTVVTC